MGVRRRGHGTGDGAGGLSLAKDMRTAVSTMYGVQASGELHCVLERQTHAVFKVSSEWASRVWASATLHQNAETSLDVFGLTAVVSTLLRKVPREKAPSN